MNTITIHPVRRRFYKIDNAGKVASSDTSIYAPEKEKTPTEIPVVYISPKVSHLPAMNKNINPLMTYEEINHHDGRLFFHIWPDKNVITATSKDITFNTTEDYMVMILRFPFSSKGQYFATATSFIDAGFSTFDYVEHLDDLVDLKLD